MFHAVAGYRPFDEGDPDSDDLEVRFPQLVDEPYTLPEDVPDDVVEWVARQDLLLDETRCPERLREVAQAAVDAGLDREVVGAHLSALYREMVGRDIE